VRQTKAVAEVEAAGAEGVPIHDDAAPNFIAKIVSGGTIRLALGGNFFLSTMLSRVVVMDGGATSYTSPVQTVAPMIWPAGALND